MPAISAAANPVTAISPPASAGNGGAAARPETADRSFATVLARQNSDQPKSADKGHGSAATEKANVEDQTAEGGSTSPVIVTGTPFPGPLPADASLAEAGDQAQQAGLIEAQLLASEAAQALLIPNGTGVAAANQFDRASDAGDSSTLAILSAASSSTQTPVNEEAGAGDDSLAQSVSDIRLALSRNTASGISSPPDTNLSPAKLAASPEELAQQAEFRAIRSVGNSPIPQNEFGAEGVVPGSAAMLVQTSSQTGYGREHQIVSPVGSRQWESAVGNSLVVMTGNQVSRAELVLTPPQLGRIEVSISLRGDEASAIFISSNPAVREALENALPRLREILADAGISLGQTQVGAEPQGQSARDRQNGDNVPRSDVAGAAGDGPLQPGAIDHGNAPHRGLSRAFVDTYA